MKKDEGEETGAFAQYLVASSKDIDEQIVGLVNKNFWDLLMSDTKKRFTPKEVSDKTAKKLEMLAEAFNEVYDLCVKTARQSSELTLALNNLEQAVMWLNKAIVNLPPRPTMDGGE